MLYFSACVGVSCNQGEAGGVQVCAHDGLSVKEGDPYRGML